MKRSLLLLSVVFGLQQAAAQSQSTTVRPEPDQEFRRILDETGLANKIDSDGDFSVTLSYDDGRRQIVYALSATQKVKNIPIRTLISNAYRFTPPLDPALGEKLLRLNGSYKTGGWILSSPSKSDGKMTIQWSMQIPPFPDAESLRSALLIVGGSADVLEKELTGKDDN